MRAPNNQILGLAILVVALVAGFALIGSGDPDEPEVRKAPSRATIERELRDGEVLAGPASAPFELRHPDDWTAVAPEQLAEQEPAPAAGLRRTDNSGLLTVSVREPIRGGLASLRRTLPADLERRFPDFRLVAIRQVRVPAGRALYTSFVREGSGQVQTLLVVPDGDDRSYQVDAVIRSEARDTAAQLGAMLGTFDLRE